MTVIRLWLFLWLCWFFNSLLMWKYRTLIHNELTLLNQHCHWQNQELLAVVTGSQLRCVTQNVASLLIVYWNSTKKQENQLSSVNCLISNRRLSHWPYVLCFYWLHLSWTEQNSLNHQTEFFWRQAESAERGTIYCKEWCLYLMMNVPKCLWTVMQALGFAKKCKKRQSDYKALT